MSSAGRSRWSAGAGSTLRFGEPFFEPAQFFLQRGNLVT
jgi:hypothetical protein